MSVSRFRSPLGCLLMACLCAMVLFGGPRVASAGSIIESSSNSAIPNIGDSSLSGTWTTLATNGPNPNIANYVNAGFPTLDALTGTNVAIVTATTTGTAPGKASGAREMTNAFTVSNVGGTTQTIYLAFGTNGYNAPNTPPSIVMKNTLTLTGVSVSGTDTVSILAYVSQDNKEGHLGDITAATPVQTLSINGVQSSASSTASALITSLSSGYAMNQLYVITLGAGDTITISDTQVLSPEPTSTALFVIGVVGMCGYGWRRKRQGLSKNVELPPAV
jgi:hypothetical protein